MNWAYGVTTVPHRVFELLPKTLASLNDGGFSSPRIFMDGPPAAINLSGRTVRDPAIGAFANWVLTLWELYARDCQADRYAIFQDDIAVYRRLREYLEQVKYKPQTYWNLYTFKENQKLCPPTHEGFYESNQMGYGALALVFDNQSVQALLTSPQIVMHLRNPTRAHKCIDGVVSGSFKEIGWKEQVHNPSLVQHTGNGQSTLKNPTHPLAESFRGEDFDAMDLLK